MNILNESKQSVAASPGKRSTQTQNFSNKGTAEYKQFTGRDHSLRRGVQKKSRLNEQKDSLIKCQAK